MCSCAQGNMHSGFGLCVIVLVWGRIYLQTSGSPHRYCLSCAYPVLRDHYGYGRGQWKWRLRQDILSILYIISVICNNDVLYLLCMMIRLIYCIFVLTTPCKCWWVSEISFLNSAWFNRCLLMWDCPGTFPKYGILINVINKTPVSLYV